MRWLNNRRSTFSFNMQCVVSYLGGNRRRGEDSWARLSNTLFAALICTACLESVILAFKASAHAEIEEPLKVAAKKALDRVALYSSRWDTARYCWKLKDLEINDWDILSQPEKIKTAEKNRSSAFRVATIMFSVSTKVCPTPPSTGIRIPPVFVPGTREYVTVVISTDSGRWCTYAAGTGTQINIALTDDAVTAPPATPEVAPLPEQPHPGMPEARSAPSERTPATAPEAPRIAEKPPERPEPRSTTILDTEKPPECGFRGDAAHDSGMMSPTIPR
jgi:hypothetical protein